MGTLAQTDIKSNCNLDRGESRTSVASRMKFFVIMITVNSWESLAVVRKR